MFQNYVVVALRNLIKNKLFSVINTVGLAVGLAACIAIMLFVRDEISYDKHWANAEQLHRITTTFKLPGREPMPLAYAPDVARTAAATYFADAIEKTTRLRPAQPIIEKDGNSFQELVLQVDPDFQDMFQLTVLQGSMAEVLGNPGMIALSETLVTKYFGADVALGQTLTVTIGNQKQDAIVGAIYEDLPTTTALVMPAISLYVDQREPNFWYNVQGMVFVQFKEGTDVAAFDARMKAFVDTQAVIPAAVRSGNDGPATEFLGLHRQALVDIQLGSSHLQGGDFKPTGDIARVTMFSAIAGLILIVGCINFMNLAIASSTRRAREVAMRKVMGAERRQLVLQFLGESTLIAVIGMLLAIALVEVGAPYLGAVLGKELNMPYDNLQVWGLVGGLVAFVGILGGSYPALVVSGFRPSRVLQSSRATETKGSNLLRGGLVTFQFSISIGLIVATGVVYGQMLYANNLEPGFTKENMLVVGGFNQAAARQKHEAFRAEVERIQGIESVTFGFDTPFASSERNQSIRVPGNAEIGDVVISRQTVGYDYFKTYEIPLLAGRSFSRDFSTDVFPFRQTAPEGETLTSAAIVNESALKRIGFASPDEALGKVLNMTVGGGNRADFIIVGVVPDTYFRGLKLPVKPEFYALWPTQINAMTARFSGDPAVINAAVEDAWKRVMQGTPYDSQFIEEIVGEQFALERNTGNLLGLFSTLTVLIACLGLYGLAAFTAVRRTKEIGVRKVMGAQVFDIVKLLVWQFSKPVLFANLIAWPVTVWGMMQWLETFPYRIDAWLMAPLCVIAGLLALAIAWATVGGNAAKVARANPITALRYE
ncbi:MAG: hypothetical protein COB37_05085 [Kordiimonadales bacterium]|nr:MAG: hypothetical protein COB37_05085 [Kordiimonadales bacterium]